MDETAKLKFKYYVVDLSAGVVNGTNSDEKAEEYSMDQSYIVINASNATSFFEGSSSEIVGLE